MATSGFTYSAATKTLHHYVNGKKVSSAANIVIQKLQAGEEDYLSIGRNGYGKIHCPVNSTSCAFPRDWSTRRILKYRAVLPLFHPGLN
jgi:hypothetical protein